MKIFLDTNILLDIIEERGPFLLAALNVFDLGMKGSIKMYATSLTFANCMFVARKHIGHEKALEGLRFIKKYVRIAAMDEEQCQLALASNMPDFEDMLQYEAAISAECDVIVTRDENRHFPTQYIPIMSPEHFLNTYAKDFND